jgi:outer membrane immunogenic protein
MKKLVIALAAAAAFSAPAFAADMAAKAPRAAAPVAYAPSFTGCYIGAGGGGAYSNNDHNTFVTATGVPVSFNSTTGARGWFGTVGAGCDYQVDRWVFGVFGDYDFMDIKGDHANNFFGAIGQQKQDWQWAVGGRIGYVVLPNLLGYVSGGFTQGHWKSTNYTFFGGLAPALTTSGFTRDGWFIGAGDEYALGFLPGLFWKTEYRYSEFDRANTPILTLPALDATGLSESQNIREHSVRSELVYRFNWGGPVVAKY